MDMSSQQKTAIFMKTFPDFVKNIILKPTSIKDPSQLFRSIKSLKQYLKENALAVIIALHAYEGLYYFLQFTANQLLEATNSVGRYFTESDRKNLKAILNNILNLIYNCTFQCFLRRQTKKYEDIIKKCMKVITIEKEKQSSLSFLLVELAKIQNIAETQDKRKKLNSFITHHLMVERAHNSFEQIALNWLKKKVQKIQNEEKQNVCCHILFEHKITNELGKFSQSLNQEFKDYRWPLQNESIKFHLTKTVVGFLNTTGGIIYVGLKQDKKKMIEVKGIKLNSQEKIDFLYFLHNDIMRGVYPKEPDRKKDEQDQAKQPNKATEYQKRLKEQFESSEDKFEFRINKYVHVDFIDIYDKNTLLNSRQEGCSLYIVRIKIKIGDCRELYHVINKDKQIPEAYLREDKSVKKKSLIQFYTLFYQRMKNADPVLGNAKIQQHPNCRFSIRCTEA